jgi:hypothetical protein
MDLLISPAILLLPDQVLCAPHLKAAVAHIRSASCATIQFKIAIIARSQETGRDIPRFIAQRFAKEVSV